MSDQSSMSYKAGQVTGQAQVKKDELMGRASEACQNAKEQAGGLLQQTGEQMRSMAQGAADAVKNAVGAGDNSSSTTTTTRR